jgi:hypothetical protein
MRLIDADKLREDAIHGMTILTQKMTEFQFDNCFPYWKFSRCIKEAPTVDAVTVVRFKDCKRYKLDEVFHAGFCNGKRCMDDDFCSYGEKNE